MTKTERCVGIKKKSVKGDFGMGRCDKCENTNLEKYKVCLTCLKGKRQQRTEENSREVTIQPHQGQLYY